PTFQNRGRAEAPPSETAASLCVGLRAVVRRLLARIIRRNGEPAFSARGRQRRKSHRHVAAGDLRFHFHLRHAGKIVPHFLHQLHSEFLVRHFPAAKLQLHAHLVAAVEELLAVADFREVIVVVDVYPELDLFQFGPGSLLVLLLLGNVVTELAEIDDLADRRVRRGRDLDQIETETLSFAQRVREFHDAELLAGGSHYDPHLAGANPTVYTNLLLQIKSNLQTGDA